MIMGSLGDLFAAQRLALQAAATSAAAQAQLDHPAVSLAQLNVIGFGRAQASGSTAPPVPTPLQTTSIVNPNATSATAGAASSSKTPLIIGAAVLGLVALLAIAKKKKR